MTQFSDLLLEKLAKLEHEQWMEWTKNVEKDIDHISDRACERLDRWHKLWKPYSELTEEQKEQDREWVRKTLAIISENCVVVGRAQLEALIIDVQSRYDAWKTCEKTDLMNFWYRQYGFALVEIQERVKQILEGSLKKETEK